MKHFLVWTSSSMLLLSRRSSWFTEFLQGGAWILPDFIVPFQHLFAILLRRCHRSNLACCPATVLRASFQSFQSFQISDVMISLYKIALHTNPLCIQDAWSMTWTPGKNRCEIKVQRNCCTTPICSSLKDTISMSHKLRNPPKIRSSFQAPSKNMRLPSSESSWKV